MNLSFLSISFWDLIGNPLKFLTDLIGLIVNAIIKLITDPISTVATGAIDEFTRSTQGSAGAMLEKFGGQSATDLLTVVQTGAATLATIFFLVRILEGMRNNLTGEKTVNYAEIVGSFIISAVLIGASPFILIEVVMAINNGLVNTLLSWMGVGSMAGSTVSDYLPDLDLIWVEIFMRILVFVSLFLFAFASAMRYIELILLLFMGPIIATTYTNRSKIFMSYWGDCVAVVFTQTIQVFLLGLLLNVMPNIASGGGLDAASILLMVGIVMVALQGPSFLRQYMQSAGMGGAAAQAMGSYRNAKQTAGRSAAKAILRVDKGMKK